MRFLWIAVLCWPLHNLLAQSLIRQLDSLRKLAPGEQFLPPGTDSLPGTGIDTPVYFSLLAHNVKQTATFSYTPDQSDWKGIGIFLLATAGVMGVEKDLQRESQHWRRNSRAMNDISEVVTEFGGAYEGGLLALLGAWGYITKKDRMKSAVLLSTQACITGGLWATGVKWLSGRQRPDYYDPFDIGPRGRFHGPFPAASQLFEGRKIESSFPSRHTVFAFAAATVFAMEYRDRPFIPVLAYTSASLVGLSRIVRNRHWGADVLAGAALGYLSGRQAVRNYHRYRKLRQTSGRRWQAQYGLQIGGGVIRPSIVVQF